MTHMFPDREIERRHARGHTRGVEKLGVDRWAVTLIGQRHNLRNDRQDGHVKDATHHLAVMNILCATNEVHDCKI